MKRYKLISYIVIVLIGLVIINPVTTRQAIGIGVVYLGASFIEYWKCKYFYDKKIQS